MLMAAATGEVMQQPLNAGSTGWSGIHRLLLLVMSAVIIVLAVSTWHTDRLVRTFTAQIDAIMTVRLQITESHLWLEEIVSGDDSESEAGVFVLLDQAALLLQRLSGKGRDRDDPIEMHEQRLHSELTVTSGALTTFRRLARERLDGNDGAVGSALDQRFDDTYEGLQESLMSLETDLQDVMQRSLQRFVLQQTLMIVALAAVFAWILILLRRKEQQDQDEHVRDLHNSFAELERSRAELARQNARRALIMQVSDNLQGIEDAERMADILLQFLCREGNAPAAAFWINDPEEGLEPLTGYALDTDHFNASREDMNDGPVGQAVRLAKPVVMDVPGRYLLISSASGEAAPAHIRVLPLVHDSVVVAVAEFAWFAVPDEDILNLFETVLASVAVRFQLVLRRRYQGQLQVV